MGPNLPTSRPELTVIRHSTLALLKTLDQDAGNQIWLLHSSHGCLPGLPSQWPYHSQVPYRSQTAVRLRPLLPFQLLLAGLFPREQALLQRLQCLPRKRSWPIQWLRRVLLWMLRLLLWQQVFKPRGGTNFLKLLNPFIPCCQLVLDIHKNCKYTQFKIVIWYLHIHFWLSGPDLLL